MVVVDARFPTCSKTSDTTAVYPYASWPPECTTPTATCGTSRPAANHPTRTSPRLGEDGTLTELVTDSPAVEPVTTRRSPLRCTCLNPVVAGNREGAPTRGAFTALTCRYILVDHSWQRKNRIPAAQGRL